MPSQLRLIHSLIDVGDRFARKKNPLVIFRLLSPKYADSSMEVFKNVSSLCNIAIAIFTIKRGKRKTMLFYQSKRVS